MPKRRARPQRLPFLVTYDHASFWNHKGDSLGSPARPFNIQRQRANLAFVFSVLEQIPMEVSRNPMKEKTLPKISHLLPQRTDTYILSIRRFLPHLIILFITQEHDLLSILYSDC